MNKKIYENMSKHNLCLSKYACKDEDAIRFKDIAMDYRPPFFRDADKIVYSLGYTRYINKTQVFSNVSNDMVSKRITHVQMVSKIARTIGRALNLNEDLIEAASLGHDLGHVPIGHVGEKILNDISLRNNEGYFNHNVQSVHLLMDIEKGGNGQNLTIQVLDAILCHNGEILENVYKPEKKSKEQFLNEYKMSYKDKDILKKIRPMTLEGCVVRISDVIAYIGRDIEDAIRMVIISKDLIPSNIALKLGTTNSSIVNTLVSDIIENSIDKNYIKISDELFGVFKELLDFNYRNIYYKSNTEEKIKKYTLMFNKLFELYVEQIEDNKANSDIFEYFLKYKNTEYNSNTSARKAIDFIAGMTDNYFIRQYNKYFG